MISDFQNQVSHIARRHYHLHLANCWKISHFLNFFCLQELYIYASTKIIISNEYLPETRIIFDVTSWATELFIWQDHNPDCFPEMWFNFIVLLSNEDSLSLCVINTWPAGFP